MKIRYLNPRYDAPFKYLLEDDDFAKGLIGVIIGANVLSLESKPQEKIAIDAEPLNLVIYRKDYRAVIERMEDGKLKKETVKIEMQKSYLSPHIDRFREYTGAEYSKPYKIEKIIKKNQKGEDIEYVRKYYLPIITIYFIEKVFNATLPSVLKVGKEYYDVLQHQPYAGKRDKFVEILTHEAYFIQIEKLPHKLRKEFEVLKIFNGNIVDENETLMELDVDTDIKKGNSLLTNALFILSSIAGDKNMQRKMNEERKFELTYLQNVKQKEIIEFLDDELVKAKGKVRKKDQQLEEKDQQLEEKEQQLIQNKQALLKSAKIMKDAGVSTDQIHLATGLSIDEIEKL